VPYADHKQKIFSVIALTAVAMGLRNSVVRRLAIPDLTTTVLTLTIAGLAADSSLASGDNPRWQRRGHGHPSDASRRGRRRVYAPLFGRRSVIGVLSDQRNLCTDSNAS
jgi:hypothetical protein